MTLLAIDTSTEVCSVALWRDALIGESFQQAGAQASRIILGMIDDLFREHALGWDDLDVLAFAHGPGSFTGVRVATGLVQGLALGRNLPVVGISTLAAIAMQAQKSLGANTGSILAVQDARMGELYWGCYRQDKQNNLVCIQQDCLSTPEQLRFEEAGIWYGAGNAYPLYAGEIESAIASSGKNISLQWLSDIFPRASNIAALAHQALQTGRSVSPAAEIEPVYLRNKVTQKKGA